MMNRNDLRRADINLLVVFRTMMHEQNVTRVSESCFSASPRSAVPWRACG